MEWNGINSLGGHPKKDRENQNELKDSEHQSKIDYITIQCAHVKRFNNDFMSERFRHKKIRYFSDSKIMKKHTYENYSSFFKKHISINILRFEKNKRKRNKSMLLREQTHINSRFKLLFQIRKFSHTADKIDKRFQ